MIKQAVVLAGGKSERFWPLNKKNKSLIKILGKPLIFYTLEGLKKADISEVIVVQTPEREIEEEVKKYKLPLKTKFLVQKKPNGMGDALWQAKDLIKGRFLISNASRVDVGDIVKTALPEIKGKKNILFGKHTDNPQLYGILKIKGSKVLDVVEKPKKGKEPSNVRAVGCYILESSFFDYYRKVKKEQYDFEKTLSYYLKKNETYLVFLKGKKVPSLKYPWHLIGVKNYLFDRFLKPEIKKSAQVSPKALLSGKVHVGENVRIFENAIIKGPCYIGDNCVVGNNVLLRDYTNLERNCTVGANGEVTRSVFQENSTCHSGYIGDSIVGRNCKIGAGVITANVRIDRGKIKALVSDKKINTSLNKFGLVTGDNVISGIRCSFMPGVMIGSGAVIGPGSMLMGNVKNEELFYTEQKVKKNRK
jgi:bifunctional UDP-N-acetylglucosamine pyrophosphorylase/glucosamine-1-phosphate N-acetyltransferase